MRRVLAVSAILAMASPPGLLRAQAPRVGVADLIGMTLLSSDAHNGAMHDTHVVSPDGRHLAVVVQTGNLARNTVDYALLVLPTDQPLPRPDTVVARAATSNDAAISHLVWLADNRTIAFLGGDTRGVPQVLTVDVATHAIVARTHSATGVTEFEIAPSGDPIIYQQRAPVDSGDYAALRAHGFAVEANVWPSDLIGGDFRGVTRAGTAPGYRILRRGRDTALVLPDSTAGWRQCEVQPLYGPPLSPTGDGLLVACDPLAVPPRWGAYTNPRYRLFADHFGARGQVLVLLDLATGRGRPVLDAPLMPQCETNFVWAPDGRSFLLSMALLPLTGPDSSRRARARVAVEVDLRTGAITPAVPRDSLVVQSWDARSGIVEFAQGTAWFEVNDQSPRAYYRKTARGWTPVASGAGRMTFLVTQDINTPPRLVARDQGTHGATRLVLDPDPGLTERRRFAHVEVLHWTTRAGRTYAGGLYLPPDLVAGRRYPLVLQTHGYDSTLFSPEGAFTTGSAAQPLAAAGVVVLQAGERVAGPDFADSSPEEGAAYQDMWEGAIAALDQRGLIDRTKVGLQGFSRTCFAALYFLTHSSYPIAAADLSDGVDYSYLQYLVYHGGADDERMNGGKPWGATHAQWLERAAGFRLDRVTAPLRLTAISSHSVLQEWEPYAGLLAQGKPAELVYIPEGEHILVKPWERMTSQHGAVDWWRFWLQDYEDPDPARAGQYARWHKLRAMRDSSTATSSR